MPRTLYDPTEIEYLDGRPHPKVSPRLTHGLVQAALVREISRSSGDRGVVVTEVRFEAGARDGSKTELIPDVAYISGERLDALSQDRREKPPFSPDIAVEVRSPSDDVRYLRHKIERYLKTGSILVLDVDPAQRTIYAHAAQGVATFRSGEAFVHPAVPWLHFDVDSVLKLQ